MRSAKNMWFYIKSYRKNSLFFKTLILIFALLTIPFASLSVLFYTNISNAVTEEIALENVSMLNSAKNITDSLLNECDMLSSYISNNDNAQRFMLGAFQSDTLGDLSQLTKALPLIYKYIDSVYIYSEYNQAIFNGDNKHEAAVFADCGWIEEYRSITDRKGSIIARAKNDVYPQLITFIKPIYVADVKRGAVVMNVDCRALYRSVMSDDKKNKLELFLLDEQNRILLSKDADLFNTGAEALNFDLNAIEKSKNRTKILNLDNEKNVVTIENSDIFPYQYISVLPMDAYASKLRSMSWQTVSLMLVLLALGFALAYIITSRSYKPLREIISFLDESAAEDKLKIKNQNELIYIMNNIEQHIEDKKKMREMLEERMQMLQRSQYVMLQAQINPHFLYNTLEAINWMAYDLSGSENDVSKALISLSNFFRNTLSTSGYLVSIKTEILYTKDYINILKLRYGDLFEVAWDVAEDILGLTTIKICLQPIIENAVYHGLKPKGDNGLLTIAGRRSGDSVVFTVSDNGVGMSETDINELNSRMRDEVYTENRHIGLVNVNRRIKIIFGESYGIAISSRLGEGTIVKVTTPAAIWENDSPRQT